MADVDDAIKTRVAQMRAAGMKPDEIMLVLMKSGEAAVSEADETTIPAAFSTWVNTMPDALFNNLLAWLATETGSRDPQEKYRQMRIAAASRDKVKTFVALLAYVKAAKHMHGSVSI